MELIIDAGITVDYLSKSLKMRTTFIAFAILLILGMIQVKGRKRSVRNGINQETVRHI
jgi:hypothetical protein